MSASLIQNKYEKDAKVKRGYSCIGLYKPKDKTNVGSVLRAAHVYGSKFVSVQGARNGSLKQSTDTSKAINSIPVFTSEDLLDYRAHGCQIVVVDLIESAQPLPDFKHPDRAMYIFGPEDGTLGKRHTDKAQHVVYIPGKFCMNLAATVNVVLYDRMMKRKEW